MIAKLGQTVQPLFGRNWGNKGPMRSSSAWPHGWRQCPASQTWWRKMNTSEGQNMHIFEHSQGFFQSANFARHNKITNTPPLSSLPVSWGDDIVYRGWRWVSGGAEWLTQTVGPCLGEHEPVSDVELRQQTVLHYLVQVIPRGTPQAAAEHWNIQGCVLLTHRAEIIYLVIQRTTIFINWIGQISS